jgi:hypothetical protein
MGWFLSNIVVPILAPLCVSLLFYCLPLSRAQRKRLSPLRAVKDGQLCWVALAYSAAGIYDLYGRMDAPWLFGTLLATLVASSLLASAGTLFQTSVGARFDENRLLHFRCLVASLVLTIVAAAGLTFAHFL